VGKGWVFYVELGGGEKRGKGRLREAEEKKVVRVSKKKDLLIDGIEFGGGKLIFQRSKRKMR